MKSIEKYLYPLILAVLSVVSFFIGTFLCVIEIDACFVFIFLSPIIAIIAIVYSIILLAKDIFKKNRILKNYLANISAILLAGVILYSIFIAGVFRISQVPDIKIQCYTHLSSLGKACLIYSNENNDYYPDCNQWCDLLIIFIDARPLDFICYGSDAVIGESSYAMNINLKGKKLGQLNPDTVMLFETNYGKDPNGRDVTVSSRYSYKAIKEKGGDVGFFDEYPKRSRIYEKRWNQAGGPEMLSAENHKGEGANILFTDGSVRWIPKKDFNNLNWGTKSNIE